MYNSLIIRWLITCIYTFSLHPPCLPLLSLSVLLPYQSAIQPSPPITQLKMDFKPHHLRPYSKYANAKCRQSEGVTRISLIFIHKLEIRDSQNLAKLRHGCTTKLSDGGGEGIEFCFNWRCGWVATMVPNWELRSTFWSPFASM